ncbi:response regulator transcription factor [Cohnella silvisoli]|uniref:Response regulator n=1 Tax=Cohnella silvisoli TaxID=2873699 RepID=A0ABV1KXL5_9BACL|nr:response regulator [Cohnella silvisoli]MCD9024106.1 response regulator [Cohnella silvisoli]
MYRLLIVDDEPIIVEGLYDKFQQLADSPYEVYKAFNGEEALEVARRVRVDLLLTDLKMPGIDGLELQNAVGQLWPKCKTIFLTGHTDFHSIQASLRSGAFDYVLKMEEDAKIIQAVFRAADRISEENSLDRMLSDARNRWTQALPILRKEYVLELLHGDPSTPTGRAARFADLKLSLRSDMPVHLCVGRVDEWREDIHSGDKSLFLYGVHNVIDEHFADGYDCLFVTYGQDRFLWLMQQRREGSDGARSDTGAADRKSQILGLVESVQTACRTFMKLPCSFVAGCMPCDWEELSRKFGRLDFQLTQGLGLGREMLLSDGFASASTDSEFQFHEREIGLLTQALERKDGIDFHRRLDVLSAAVRETDGIRSGSALALFYSLSSAFLLLLNRRGLLEALSEKIDMNKLLGAQAHATWREAARFFGELADLVIESVEAESGKESSEVVLRVEKFVRENVGGDLSLARLAEVVHLTPFYLSRLYKQQTGHNLTDYITELKLSRAKELLVGTTKKIYEIGLELGFHSSPYFNHYFKKMTNMTPQEYRDTWAQRVT